MKVENHKSQVKQVKMKPKTAGGGSGIPPGIKTIPVLSPTPGEMCRNQGGWGEPCRYDFEFFNMKSPIKLHLVMIWLLVRVATKNSFGLTTDILVTLLNVSGQRSNQPLLFVLKR